MLNQIIRQLLNRLISRGISKGVDFGINQMSRGRHGARGASAPGTPVTEAEKLNQQRAAEMKKRAQDMAKLTRRMR